MLEKIQDAPEAYLTDVLAPRVGRDNAKIRKDSTDRDRIRFRSTEREIERPPVREQPVVSRPH